MRKIYLPEREIASLLESGRSPEKSRRRMIRRLHQPKEKKKADVLVLGEIAMMSKVDLERIEKSLRLLMENDHPFGGKIVILSGDFRQILPVEK